MVVVVAVERERRRTRLRMARHMQQAAFLWSYL
jgi:hypothetical protein